MHRRQSLLHPARILRRLPNPLQMHSIPRLHDPAVDPTAQRQPEDRVGRNTRPSNELWQHRRQVHMPRNPVLRICHRTLQVHTSRSTEIPRSNVQRPQQRPLLRPRNPVLAQLVEPNPQRHRIPVPPQPAQHLRHHQKFLIAHFPAVGRPIRRHELLLSLGHRIRELQQPRAVTTTRLPTTLPARSHPLDILHHQRANAPPHVQIPVPRIHLCQPDSLLLLPHVLKPPHVRPKQADPQPGLVRTLLHRRKIRRQQPIRPNRLVHKHHRMQNPVVLRTLLDDILQDPQRLRLTGTRTRTRGQTRSSTTGTRVPGRQLRQAIRLQRPHQLVAGPPLENLTAFLPSPLVVARVDCVVHWANRSVYNRTLIHS